MRLRSSLFLLSAATALPLIAFALIAAAFVVQQENRNLEAAAKARNRATMGAVDAELRGVLGTLKVVSVSRALTAGDLKAFHALGGEILKTQSAWSNMLLHDATGRPLVDLSRPYGAPIPEQAAAHASIEKAIRTGQPVFEDLIASPQHDNVMGLPVRLPVVRDGKVVYVLTAVLTTDTFQQMLVAQNLPQGWVSGLVDTRGRLIARVPPRPPGAMSSTDYLNNISKSAEGWYRGRTLENTDSFTAFLRSDLSAWTIGYAVPVAVLSGGAVQGAWLMGTGILFSIAAAAVLGYWLIRRISKPMSDLADSAALLGAGQHPPAVSSTIDEVSRLSAALGAAARAIETRDGELRRSEAELRQQAAELRRADVNKSQFLALLSHELRNPLAPLRNGLTILKMRGDGRGDGRGDSRGEMQGLTDVHAMMERQVAHMTRLIDDLLDVSRIDRGQLELRRERIAVDTFVNSAIETAKPSLEAQHVELVVHYAATPLYVDGDPVRLSQVVSNLLNNAAKFTAARGCVELRIVAHGAEVEISVKDNGIGFAAEDRARIFEMFVQLDAGRGHHGGLGIGLTIVRSLVQMHAGRIEAHSAGPGQGSTFTVWLPLAAAPAAAVSMPLALRSAGAKRRVLVVDDNIDAAQSLAQILRLDGFDVREAYDGESALEIARGFDPEVAFLDMNMPGMDGAELGRRLLELRGPRGVRLIAVTGMGQKSDVEATRSAGFSAHLTKPAAAEDILRFASDNVVQLRGDRHRHG